MPPLCIPTGANEIQIFPTPGLVLQNPNYYNCFSLLNDALMLAFLKKTILPQPQVLFEDLSNLLLKPTSVNTYVYIQHESQHSSTSNFLSFCNMQKITGSL
jgi:hypothetical protein